MKQGSTQVEERLSQRERELADFVENGVIGLHWVAADGKIIWANQAELNMLGYTRDEYIGHYISEFYVSRSAAEAALTQLTAGETLRNYEVQMRCKDGSIRHVLVSSNVRFKDGQFLHTRCFTVDITERKQVEDRIVLLYQLTAALSEALTAQQVANVIMQQGIESLGASAGSIVLLNKEKTHLEILVAIGYSDEIAHAWQRFSVNSPVVLSEFVRSQEPIWLHSFDELQSRFPAMTPWYNDGEYTSWAAIPLIVERRLMGALGLSFAVPQKFDEHDRRFMVALAQQCAQALERARLSEEAQDLAVLEERQRLARDLHDSVSQSLFSISIMAQALPQALEKDAQRGQHQLQQLIELSQSAVSEMRTLLLELRPNSLVKTSLQDLFTQLLHSIQTRKSIAIKANIDLKRPLPEEVHIVLYRIAQESIHNMVKHSEATEGSITLSVEAGQLVMRIRDNGQGFDTTVRSTGLGLGIMRERALLIGATFEANSTIGKGTEIIVRWTLPL